MTQIIPFTPVATKNFQFRPTLDGQVYNAVIKWNFAAQRYYLNIISVTGKLMLTEALVGSPDGLRLESAIYKNAGASGNVTAVVAVPHGYSVYDTVALTISQCDDGFNGTYDCLIVDPFTFTYSVNSPPTLLNPLTTTPVGIQTEASSQLGFVSYDIDLIGGPESAFSTSTLVFRESSQTFEINP